MAAEEDLYGQEHVRAYLETDGKRGFVWRRGSHILLLFTKGRRTGEPRIQPLIFREDGGRHVIVASDGGRPDHPAWYLNLRDRPDDVEVQVKGDRFTAVPRDAEGEERERLWKLMAEAWPPYDEYRTRTDRQIPVVILERA